MFNWAWLLISLMSWLPCHSVSQDLFHLLTPKWFSLPLPHHNDDAYFGFSVTYVPSSKRLIVSAPQEDETGKVYSCDLNAKDCTAVPIYEKLNSSTIKRPEHNAWLGAVVKAGPSYFVTCAPRRLQRHPFKYNVGNKSYTKNEVGTFSYCFKYKDPAASPQLLPTFTDWQRRGIGSFLYEHYMDSLGWSIDISTDSILIGGPAMFTGRAIKVSPIDASYKAIRMSGYIGNKRKVQYNYGYSVLTGHFKKSDEDALVYAVSSPYGSIGYGKILFHEIKPYSNVMTFQQEIESKDDFGVGSMFGAVLCAAKLTAGSQVDWLLVGAPTYADSKSHHCNQGAVYFYAPNDDLPPVYFRKIVGKDDSFFGSSIVSLGDYNGDKMDEIAIAAPYEDAGTGAVYLYSSKDISNTNVETVPYIQRITPKANPSTPLVPLKSFGLSLATIQDFDENGCNELAIGAPEANNVMVLQCIASVTVRLYVKPPDMNEHKLKSSEDTKFTFQSCLDFDFPKKPEDVTGRIKVTVILTLNDMKIKAEPGEYEVYLRRNERTQCRDIHVVAPKDGNYEYPIIYKTSATEVDPPNLSTSFRASHVALSDRSVLESSSSIWLTECANVTNCAPNLTLSYKLSDSKEYVIGSSSNIKLSSSVANVGDAAYGACVRMYFTRTDVVLVPKGCEREPRATSPTLLCRPDRALTASEGPWILQDILLETRHLTSRDKSIDVQVGVFARCVQVTEVTWYNNTITLTSDGNITVTGMTDSSLNHKVNMTEEVDLDFQHNYVITNKGITYWVDLEAEVVVQKRPFVYFDNSSIFISPGRNNPCTVKEDNNDSVTLNCIIDTLPLLEPVTLTIPMQVQYGTLEKAIAEKINTQFSSLSFNLNGKLIEASVTSQLNYGSKKLAIWIIVVAVFVGILILLLFFWLLSRWGFFKRQDKESLKRVRHSVRRQTIMRRTMMEGIRLPLETDRQSLVAPVEETAHQAAARDRRLRLDSNATRRK